MSVPPPIPRQNVWKKFNSNLCVAIATQGPMHGSAAYVANRAITNAPHRHPIHVNIPKRTTYVIESVLCYIISGCGGGVVLEGVVLC